MSNPSKDMLVEILHHMGDDSLFRDRVRGALEFFFSSGTMICDDGRIWVPAYSGHASDIECAGLVDYLRHRDLLGDA